jgi:hypothetical protein
MLSSWGAAARRERRRFARVAPIGFGAMDPAFVRQSRCTVVSQR